MNEKALKRNLQQICEDKNLEALKYVAALMIANWHKASCIGASEWETIRNTISREERGRALNLFIEQLEQLAHE